MMTIYAFIICIAILKCWSNFAKQTSELFPESLGPLAIAINALRLTDQSSSTNSIPSSALQIV